METFFQVSNHFLDICHDMYASKSDHICLLETWLDPLMITDQSFQMSGRYFEHASSGKGKGCAVFSSTSRRSIHSGAVIKEKYQMLSIIDQDVQLVIIYISKNCSFDELVLDLGKTLKPEKKHVVTGDFNFDKDDKNALTKYLENLEFVQLVNSATQDGGRVIDHCYVPIDIADNIIVKQYSPYYSDHDALCINLNFN